MYKNLDFFDFPCVRVCVCVCVCVILGAAPNSGTKLEMKVSMGRTFLFRYLQDPGIRCKTAIPTMLDTDS